MFQRRAQTVHPASGRAGVFISLTSSNSRFQHFPAGLVQILITEYGCVPVVYSGVFFSRAFFRFLCSFSLLQSRCICYSQGLFLNTVIDTGINDMTANPITPQMQIRCIPFMCDLPSFLKRNTLLKNSILYHKHALQCENS